MVKFMTSLELVMEKSDAEVFTELCESNGWVIEFVADDEWHIGKTKWYGKELGFETPTRCYIGAKLPASDMIAFLDSLSFTVGIIDLR